MRIMGFITDPGGVGHYRILYPFRELRDQGGHEAFMAPHTSSVDEKDGSMWIMYKPPAISIREIKPDLIVIQQPMRPDWPFLMRELDIPFVVELDDWHLGMSPSNPAAASEHRQNWKVVEECMRLADCVTTTTAELRNAFLRFNPNVVVLPNFLDWQMWAPVQPNYERARPDGRIRVGWMGDPGWGRSDDIAELDGWFVNWLAQHPDVDFAHAGPRPEVMGIVKEIEEQGQFVHIPGQHFRENGPPRILDFDIGIVPLRDSRFNRCKSHLKGLEYLAAGIPFVASRLPEYSALVQMAGVGYTAKNVGQWERSLNLLLNDFSRVIQGAHGRSWAETHTIQRNWRLWEDLYASLIHEHAAVAA